MKNQFRILAACLIGIAAVTTPAHLAGQSTLISVTTIRGMVFDCAGQYLYLATSTGLVYPYNLSTGILEMPYNLGGSLNGIDIARDDSFLLVAQNNVGVSQGTFHKLDLATEMVTNINYTKAFGETGAWDVDVASNGLALVTTQYGGSGWTPLRQIDLTTNAITVRSDAPGSGSGGMVRQNTQIHHSADGTRLYFLESNSSSGPIFTYSATSNTFGPSAQANTFHEATSAAVNRNGTLLGTRIGNNVSIDTAPDFNFVHSFAGDSGIAFDGVRDILYAVNSTSDEIILYNLNNFAEKYRLSIGENVSSGTSQFGAGTLVASPDGGHLTLRTAAGVRLFTIPVLGKAVSRKSHDAAGIFDVVLPLNGPPAIESRSGGSNNDYTIVFTFTSSVVSVGNVTLTGCGQVVDAVVGADPSQLIVNLTGVCTEQYITIALDDVLDSLGNGGDFSVMVGVLVGDTTSDRFVNSADISQTKSQSGLAVTNSNFRIDANLDGSINSGDISLVKSQSGKALPMSREAVEREQRSDVGKTGAKVEQ